LEKKLSAMYREKKEERFPDRFDICFYYPEREVRLEYEKVQWDLDGEREGLRYGENPHQQAALYRRKGDAVEIAGLVELIPLSGLSSDLELLQSGKHPGKINVVDVDRALQILQYLTDAPAAAIMKHNNPCGVALGTGAADAVEKALDGDVVAAFGGALVVNRRVDAAAAAVIKDHYFEIVAAPDFDEQALELLSEKKNLRIFRIAGMDRLAEAAGKRFIECTSLIDGGLVLQNSYTTAVRSVDDFLPARAEKGGQVFTCHREPTEREAQDLLFGWLVESGVTSNSVIYVKDGATIAIGTGEQDRVGVAAMARDKAYRNLAERISRERHGKSFDLLDSGEQEKVMEEVASLNGGLKGAVMVSDGFFPFRDGVDVGLREGISAVIEPGGSLRDNEVIEACNEYGAALVFTGERSFRH
jgi:phosphoribosylaminoimidazolecarboxamide formyltransferase / IMP cyclohydrolase